MTSSAESALSTLARDAALIVAGLAVAALSILYGPVLAASWPVASIALATAMLFAAIFGPMALAALGLGAFGRAEVYSPGNAPGRWAMLGLASGVGGLAIAAGYGWLAGSLVPGVEVAGPGASLAVGAVLIAFQVGCEEIFFRGFVQRLVARHAPPLIGVAVAALVFAGFHTLGGARSPLTLVNLVLGGCWFGLLAWRSGGIVAPFAAHFGWNASEQLLFGLDPNPGIGDFGSISDWDLTGAPYWGGTEEGLNASVAMTFVLIALIVPLVRGINSHVPLAPRQSGRAPA